MLHGILIGNLHLGHRIVGIEHLYLHLALSDGGSTLGRHGEGLLVAKSDNLALVVEDGEADTAGTVHRHSVARHGTLIVCGIGHLLTECGIATHLGAYGRLGVQVQVISLVALDDTVRAIVDEEYGDVLLGIVLLGPCLDLGNGGIDFLLCLVVHGIGVVAHKAVGHHTEEAVGAEELGEVFARRIAALLVEVEQRLGTALVVLDNHRVLTQHLEQAGIELRVVSQHVVVEEELVVHVGLCPDVVGKEVRVLAVVGLEHIFQRALVAVDT